MHSSEKLVRVLAMFVFSFRSLFSFSVMISFRSFHDYISIMEGWYVLLYIYVSVYGFLLAVYLMRYTYWIYIGAVLVASSFLLLYLLDRVDSLL